LSWLRITILAFLTKHFGLLQCFPHGFFYDFFKIIFVDIFLILSWLRITITINLNHVGKAL
jgi:hypothetical protein